MLKNYSIPTGNEKEDYQTRKKFITNFYANWIAANTTKHIFNKSLSSFIEIKHLSINETAGKTACRFSKIFTMYYEKPAFGRIKLTVGELRGSKQKVQYCITAIEND